jgi:diguanylate cyclase (GGDEF)-like protein
MAFETETDTQVGKKIMQIEYIPDIRPDGTVAGMYTLSSDVTELKDTQRRLAMLVRSDTLTGLSNRYQLNEALPLALARSARSGPSVALIFLDIDHFKGVNDTFGHSAGDLMLIEFAQRLQRSVRSTDMVTRTGGDEFILILEGLHNDAEAQLVARKIIDETKRPVNLSGQIVAATTSIGIAFHSGAKMNAAELVARADSVLYEAKAAGRNTYRMSSD